MRWRIALPTTVRKLEIDHDGQIQSALAPFRVGHVRAPVPIDMIRDELSIQVIRANWQIETAV